MQEPERPQWDEKILHSLFWLSLIVFLPPLILYMQTRLTGALPSKTQWALRDVDYGPWQGKWQEGFLSLSFMAMLLFEITTLGCAIRMDGKWRNLRPSPRAQMIFLWACQFIAGFVIFLIVFWTID
jgi:hypothetical protein